MSCDEGSQESASLGRVHVHLVISSCPPLIERQQPSGFLRAARVAHEFDDKLADSDAGHQHSLEAASSDSKDTSGDEELHALKGSFVWLLVRMQRSSEQPPLLRLRRARVQYQITPATESYVLPLEHTNVRRRL